MEREETGAQTLKERRMEAFIGFADRRLESIAERREELFRGHDYDCWLKGVQRKEIIHGRAVLLKDLRFLDGRTEPTDLFDYPHLPGKVELILKWQLEEAERAGTREKIRRAAQSAMDAVAACGSVADVAAILKKFEQTPVAEYAL